MCSCGCRIVVTMSTGTSGCRCRDSDRRRTGPHWHRDARAARASPASCPWAAPAALAQDAAAAQTRRAGPLSPSGERATVTIRRRWETAYILTASKSFTVRAAQSRCTSCQGEPRPGAVGRHGRGAPELTGPRRATDSVSTDSGTSIKLPGPHTGTFSWPRTGCRVSRSGVTAWRGHQPAAAHPHNCGSRLPPDCRKSSWT